MVQEITTRSLRDGNDATSIIEFLAGVSSSCVQYVMTQRGLKLVKFDCLPSTNRLAALSFSIDLIEISYVVATCYSTLRYIRAPLYSNCFIILVVSTENTTTAKL